MKLVAKEDIAFMSVTYQVNVGEFTGRTLALVTWCWPASSPRAASRFPAVHGP